ncbi:putative late blight resistance protein homolog R1A-3 [Solanum stenotomum]|uniref:putative late blight resistance protein homolog R1A-3 n=1 Tax=Solanum stenotomum TaxID=172797 RepID=UPI0020D03198|nr:putative late blight resistance protein homolog R1A-3 [Solanum stenotomum]
MQPGSEVWRLSDDDKFKSPKLLLFSNIYLEHWEICSDSFPNPKRLVLRKCKCLPEIPTDFGEICTLESIELQERLNKSKRIWEIISLRSTSIAVADIGTYFEGQHISRIARALVN